MSSAQAGGASDELLRLLVESVRDYAIFMLDPEGRAEQGSTFHVTLPLAAEDVRSADPPPENTSLRGAVVLLLEDDPGSRLVLTKMGPRETAQRRLRRLPAQAGAAGGAERNAAAHTSRNG
jgi:hypothetical protein